MKTVSPYNTSQIDAYAAKWDPLTFLQDKGYYINALGSWSLFNNITTGILLKPSQGIRNKLPIPLQWAKIRNGGSLPYIYYPSPLLNHSIKPIEKALGYNH